jgi:hypothetical protein
MVKRFFKGSNDIYVCNGVVYISGSYKDIFENTIYAALPGEDPVNFIPVCSDPLCDHKSPSCPLFLPTIYSFVIDENESAANGNMPVIYVAYNEMYWDWDTKTIVDNGYCVKRYDARKNTTENIISGSKIAISQLYIYGDTIYYITDHGDEGYKLNSMNKSGEDIKTLKSDHDACFIVDIIDNSIFYRDFKNNIYRTDFELSSDEFIMQNADFVICGNFIYYSDSIETAVVFEGRTFKKCKIYRVPLDNQSAEPELILEDVYYDTGALLKLNDHTILFERPDISFIGDAWQNNANGKKQTIKLFNENSGIKYAYDMGTSETSVAIEIPGYNILSFYAEDQGIYILMAEKIDDIDLSKEYISDYQTIAYNSKTGKVTVLESNNTMVGTSSNT